MDIISDRHKSNVLFRQIRDISSGTKSTLVCLLETRTGPGLHMSSVDVVSPLWKDGCEVAGDVCRLRYLEFGVSLPTT